MQNTLLAVLFGLVMSATAAPKTPRAPPSHPMYPIL